LEGHGQGFGVQARLPRRSSSSSSATRPSSAAEKIRFFLFILVNAALFLRPSELFPDLGEAPIYEVLILACLLFSCGAVLRQLKPGVLLGQQITLCVLGLLPAVALSHFSHSNLQQGLESAIEFFKLVVYYLLLIALVNNSTRLKWFLFALALFTTTLTLLALLQYHGVIDVQALTTMAEKGDIDPQTGEQVIHLRLQGAGIFQDPNDICLIILTAAFICLYGAATTGLTLVRIGCFIVLGALLYAMVLTQSRGGFIATLASILVFFLVRFGWKKTIPLCLVVFPILFALVAGRQTDISSDTDTGQSRMRIWSDGLGLFREAPIFGAGQGEYVEQVNAVAHNSFVHAYAELGFLGGTLFLGAFYLCFHLFRRSGKINPRWLDPRLAKVRPYILAIVTANATAMLFLSRLYVVPTYAILGLASSFLMMVNVGPAANFARFNLALFRRVLVVSTVFLLGLHVFVRVFVNWG
jgi:O-antigen ligase